MGNTIFLNEDKHFGEIIMDGDQTSATTMQLVEASIKMNDQMSQRYGAVRTLIDVSRLGKLDIGSRVTATKGINIASFDRLAIVGASSLNEGLIKLMIGLSGKQAQIEFFDTRDKAEAWLSQ